MTDGADRQRVRVGAVDMAVVIEGAGPELVLLHGGGDDVDGLRDLRRHLVAGGHRVIAPEQRGHGATPAVDPWTFEAMADDTVGLLAALDVEAADLVGWSDGGIVALLMAHRQPGRVRRVVAIGASLAVESDPGPVRPADLDWIRTVDAAEVDFPMAVEHRRALLDLWATGPDLRFADLAGIAAPVLIMAADRDMIVAEHTLAMFRALPSAQLAILPGVGHDVPRTDPTLVAGVIERFLAG